MKPIIAAFAAALALAVGAAAAFAQGADGPTCRYEIDGEPTPELPASVDSGAQIYALCTLPPGDGWRASTELSEPVWEQDRVQMGGESEVDLNPSTGASVVVLWGNAPWQRHTATLNDDDGPAYVIETSPPANLRAIHFSVGGRDYRMETSVAHPAANAASAKLTELEDAAESAAAKQAVSDPAARARQLIDDGRPWEAILALDVAKPLVEKVESQEEAINDASGGGLAVMLGFGGLIFGLILGIGIMLMVQVIRSGRSSSGGGGGEEPDGLIS